MGRNLIFLLFPVFKHYYSCAIRYTFNAAFYKQNKIVTPTARSYYLQYALLSWLSSQFSYVQNPSSHFIILHNIRII